MEVSYSATPGIPDRRRGLVRRIASSFGPYRSRVGFIVLLILGTAGFGVVNPLLIQVVFDDALFPPDGGPDLTLLWVLAGIMVGVTVLTGSLGIVQTYLTNQVGQRVGRHPNGRLPRLDHHRRPR